MSTMRERAIRALESLFSDRAMREQIADIVLQAALDLTDEECASLFVLDDDAGAFNSGVAHAIAALRAAALGDEP